MQYEENTVTCSVTGCSNEYKQAAIVVKINNNIHIFGRKFLGVSSQSLVDQTTPNLMMSDDHHRCSPSRFRFLICCFILKPEHIEG